MQQPEMRQQQMPQQYYVPQIQQLPSQLQALLQPHLPQLPLQEEAALEFDQAAVEIRGAKAKLNFPEKFAQGEGGVGSEPAAPEAGGRMEMQGREWGRRGKRGQC
ncbi:hypothetical protein CLOM_g12131 [Closterium sp. NIES-68]|nr:hypothetical protein CLOM_g12131 [Closterium sp. NIES-68]